MFLPSQAPPVIRTRSTGASVRSPQRIRPSDEAVPAGKKVKLNCELYDVEYVKDDGTTGTEPEYLLAYHVPGGGWQHTEYPCSPPLP
jgi:hypothetical protein